MFQAKLNESFDYTCDNQHSLFYYILNDKINDKCVADIWKDVDRKLAERRAAEILSGSLSAKTGEEIDSLLEHYVTSYSTLPIELRENFYGNAEDYVLKRVVKEFRSRTSAQKYMKLLKKQTMNEVIELELALEKSIKGVRRQRESIKYEKIKGLYQGCIDELNHIRQDMHKECAVCITRSLLKVMQREIEISKEQATKTSKFGNCARVVVDTFFKKLVDAGLSQSVSEIQSTILSALLIFFRDDNWTKTLAKFRKEAIQNEFRELANMFEQVLTNEKEKVSYDQWKMNVEQELSK